MLTYLCYLIAYLGGSIFLSEAEMVINLYFIPFFLFFSVTICEMSSIWGQLKPHLRWGSYRIFFLNFFLFSFLSICFFFFIIFRSPDRKWSHAHAQPVTALFSYYSSSTKCFWKKYGKMFCASPYFFFRFPALFSSYSCSTKCFWTNTGKCSAQARIFSPYLFFGFPRFFLTIVVVR